MAALRILRRCGGPQSRCFGALTQVQLSKIPLQRDAIPSMSVMTNPPSVKARVGMDDAVDAKELQQFLDQARSLQQRLQFLGNEEVNWSEMTAQEMDSISLTDKKSLAAPEVGFELSGTRIRKSCYFDATVAAGVKRFTSYNKMLLASFFSPDEYTALKNDVCLWDVAAQRQVEISGPDALQLCELVTPRALGDMRIGDCRYAINLDGDGIVYNDPVALRLSEDRFWFSVADGDFILFAKGVAWAKGLNVRITEPPVSPCALQGPKSVLLLQELLGDWVGDLGYFKFRQTDLDGIPFLLARSGWSPERGYELYLQDESRGEELWHRLMEAGRKYNIMPGVPNQTRRIEGGMLSYGSDIKNHNALELGLPKHMVTKSSDFIGKAALERIAAEGGPQRRVVGVMLECKDPLEVPMMRDWKVTGEGGEDIGFVGSFTYSPVYGNIGIATVTKMCSKAGTKVHVETPIGRHTAIVHKLPFMPRIA